MCFFLIKTIIRKVSTCYSESFFFFFLETRVICPKCWEPLTLEHLRRYQHFKVESRNCISKRLKLQRRNLDNYATYSTCKHEQHIENMLASEVNSFKLYAGGFCSICDRAKVIKTLLLSDEVEDVSVMPKVELFVINEDNGELNFSSNENSFCHNLFKKPSIYYDKCYSLLKSFTEIASNKNPLLEISDEGFLKKVFTSYITSRSNKCVLPSNNVALDPHNNNVDPEQNLMQDLDNDEARFIVGGGNENEMNNVENIENLDRVPNNDLEPDNIEPNEVPDIDMQNLGEAADQVLADQNIGELENNNNIIVNVLRHAPFTGYVLRNPPNMTFPDVYLQDNFEQILSELNETNFKIMRRGSPHRVFLFTDAFFSNNSDREIIEDLRAESDVLPVHMRVVKMTTRALTLPALTGVFPRSKLTSLINDMAMRFQHSKSTLEGSNTQFLYATNIKIILCKTTARKVRKTTKQKNNKKGSQILGQWRAYPWGYAGRSKVINIYYKPTMLAFPTRRSLKNKFEKLSPCILLALKAHKINISTRQDKSEIINSLKSAENPNFGLSGPYSEVLLNQKIEIPHCLKDKGCTIRDLKHIERANSIPICLYYLDYLSSPKERKKLLQRKKDVKNSGANLLDDEHYTDDVTICCVRAPSKKLMNKYKDKKICNLLLIGDKHVAYVPEMHEFLYTIFNDRPNINRCPLCFGIIHDSNMLESHLKSGICHEKLQHAPKISLPPIGTRQRYENILLSEPPQATFIFDSEARMLSAEEAEKFDNAGNLQTPLTPTQGLNLLDGAAGEIGSTDIIDNNPSTSHQNEEDDLRLLFPETGHHLQAESHAKGKTIIADVHKPQSIGFVILDEKFNKLGYHEFISDNIMDTFAETLDKKAQEIITNLDSKRCKVPYLTQEQQQDFSLQKNCQRCNVLFSDTIPGRVAHRHHDHYIHPVFCEKTGELLVSNYIGAVCFTCNIFITSKRKRIAVVVHNLTYDLNLLMPGFCKYSKETGAKLEILPKGGNGYYSLKLGKHLLFIDSYSFLNASLGSLVDFMCKDISANELKTVIPLTVSYVTQTYGESLVPYVNRKQVYPYNLAKNEHELNNIKSYPEKKEFFNKLLNKPMTEQDYLFGKLVWKLLAIAVGPENMSLKIFHLYYLSLDCHLLADLWVWYSKVIMEHFGVSTGAFVTGNSLTYAAALKKSATNLGLLTKHEHYVLFKKLLRGGFVSLTRRYAKANNIELPDYNPQMHDTWIINVDWNSLYPSILVKNLPYDDFQTIDNPESFTVEKIMNLPIGENADIGYVFEIDLEIPHSLRYLTDDFPLSLINADKIKPSAQSPLSGDKEFDEQRKLLAGHFDLEEYGLDLELLQFYLAMGVKIIKIHKIVSFKQKPLFKDYITHCIEQRRKYKNVPALANTYKILANALYGKTIMDSQKYSSYSKIVHKNKIDKHVDSPFFKDLRYLGSDMFLVTKNKKNVVVKSPIFIGSIILQRAKLTNFLFFHFLAKPSGSVYPEQMIKCHDLETRILIEISRHFLKNISCLYVDTDSFYLYIESKIPGMTLDFIYKNLFFKKFLDRSNFKILSSESKVEAGSLGYFKSEIADDIAHEAIFVSPKCYSLKSIKRSNIIPTQITNEYFKNVVQNATSKILSLQNEMEFIENSPKWWLPKSAIFTLQDQKFWFNFEKNESKKIEQNFMQNLNLKDNDSDLVVYKSAMKGLPKPLALQKFPHAVYKDLLKKFMFDSAEKPISAELRNIRYSRLFQTNVNLYQTKIPLQFSDTKRFYLNKLYSIAYGHPLSYKLGYTDGNVISYTGGFVTGTRHLIGPDTNSLADEPETIESSDDEEFLNETFLNENVPDRDIHQNLYLYLTETDAEYQARRKRQKRKLSPNISFSDDEDAVFAVRKQKFAEKRQTIISSIISSDESSSSSEEESTMSDYAEEEEGLDYSKSIDCEEEHGWFL